MHQIAYIKWRDACFEQADDGGPCHADLVELDEIGWLVAENEEAVTISLELEPNADGIPSSKAGRSRLHIPKNGIVEMRVAEFGKAFPKRTLR